MPRPFTNPLAGGCFQVGYVTSDLDRAQEYFARSLGGSDFVVFKSPVITSQTLYGQPIAIDVNLAFGQLGLLAIELIQPIRGESTYPQRLAQCDWFGIHHLALQVEDYAAG